MAPTHAHRYRPRSINAGMAFTVVFSTVAGVVIVGCLIWGFVIPYIRKKYFPPKPSQTKFNQPIQTRAISLPLTHYPHRRRDRRLSRIVLYNPRLRTPFATGPANTETIILPTITPPRIVSPAEDNSQSLFTPIIERNISQPEQRMTKLYTLPRVRSKSEMPISTVHEKDFGDAKDYILALPEPLRLKSRTHEDQLIASDSSEKLADADQPSASAEKTLHPRKLFEQLKNSDPRNSTCSSTSLKVKELSDTPADDNSNGGHEEHTTGKMLQHLAEQESFPSYSACVEDVKDHAWSDSDDDDDDDEGSKSSAYNASIAAMHRLRTYRSLIGAPPPVPLSRAGTLTRPKTPVAVMRNKYDQGVNEVNHTDKTVSHNDTVSTMFRTFGDSSDAHSLQSSQTSPPKASPKASPKEYSVSTLSLLPTPLHIHQPVENGSPSTTSRHDSRSTEELDDAECSDSQIDERKNKEKEAERYISNKISNIISAVDRPVPSPLPLSMDVNVHPTPQQRGQPHVGSNIAGRARLRKRLQLSSIPASSIYSRDTQGLSIAHTPVTPDFPNPLAYRPPFSPMLPSTTGGTGESDKGTEANLIIKAKTSPADTANFKVENWRVDMEKLNFNTSPSPSLKRALSTLGPVCNSNHETSEAEADTGGEDAQQPRHSTISTELAPSEARLSSLVSPIRISDCTEIDTARYRLGDAPGGAYWL